jgi:nicotinate-nucleotide--dimethylbenzimidazole phosphoribosyltransferase
MQETLDRTLARIVPQDAEWRRRARARLDQLTMPHWALGRLMDVAEEFAGITRSMNPPVARRTIVTMAGDHGVVAEGVSKFPQAVTPQMVRNFVAGGAGINALAAVARARVVVVDMGVAADLTDLVRAGKLIDKRVGPGTRNMVQGPAMTRDEALRSLAGGIEVARELAAETDLFGTGEMGIGNTTPSAAIAAALTGEGLELLTGRGTGIDDAQLRHKRAVIARALELNRPRRDDGLDVLSKVGGFEIGGIAGLILGAAAARKPVLIDGFISTAGALIAAALCPVAREYMIAAHRSEEPGHRAMLKHLGKSPLLDLNLRLGEGTGAAVAMGLVDASVAVLTRVATFEEAAVSKANA